MLKHDDCFAVFDSHGDIGAAPGGPDGLYYRDTRHLGHLEFLINGTQPLLLGSSVRDDNTVFTVDLTNPDLYLDLELSLSKDTLHVHRTIFICNACCFQRWSVENFGQHSVDCTLTLTFGSDFADVFEVRGMRRTRRGASGVTADSKVTVLQYEGLDGVRRETVLTFNPVPMRLSKGFASYQVSLRAHSSIAIDLAIQCLVHPGRAYPTRSFRNALQSLFKERQGSAKDVAIIRTSNEIFNEVIDRSMSDLIMLSSRTSSGLYPYAGIPWYSTMFGRDGIITAIQTLWCYPALAEGVLRRLARYQATRSDELADAEPGKILHEMRSGEMAALREVPFGLYFGSVDSTPLYIVLYGLYVERTMDVQTAIELWPHVEAGLQWIDGPGDPDHDGFVEYHRATESGLVNQGWKDSQDAVFHADGSLAVGPIALCEVQAYVYAAKRLAAKVAALLGKHDRAAAINQAADLLVDRFDVAFWCEELGTYALALDGAKRQCRVRTSNAGQVLMSGISAPRRAERVVRSLMQPNFFSGWGIRTVAQGEVRYNPMSYHNGSVWPHDNSLIALGFAHYGYKPEIERISAAMFNAASYFDLRRLPELFCGFQRARQRGPTRYPVACSPQAWAAGAPLLMLQALLGLEFKPEQNSIVFRNPHLPGNLSEMTFCNVSLGDHMIDFCLKKIGATCGLTLLRNEDNINVEIVYP
jgi:glycogen debranching enzyme